MLAISYPRNNIFHWYLFGTGKLWGKGAKYVTVVNFWPPAR